FFDRTSVRFARRLSGSHRKSGVIRDETHLFETEHVEVVAQLIGRRDHRNHGNGCGLVGLRNLAQRVGDRHLLLGRGERVWGADVILLPLLLVDLAVAGVAQASAMTEDVERARVSIFAGTRGSLIGFGIIEKNASLVGRAAVINSVDLEIGANIAVLRSGEIDRNRLRYVDFRLTSPSPGHPQRTRWRSRLS